MKYILAYFKTADESMYLASSSDGFIWDEVNNGNAVLSCTIGNKSIRDPFLLKAEDDIIMLSTNSWQSDQIILFKSKDFKSWSEGKLIDFSGNGFINCWAPEAKKIGEDYYIYWSSSTGQIDENDWNHRIYYTKTRDFEQFTTPKLFLDCEYSCIDATLFEIEDQLYMCFKDERLSVPTEKSLKLARFNQQKQIFESLEEPISKSWVEGPTWFTSKGVNYIYYDEYTRDKWGLIKSENLSNWQEVDEQSFKLPDGVRHGSILKVDDVYDI